jgi:GT2 family glycosyltransferase
MSMISVVIISKDEESLDDTLVDVAKQASSLAEPYEIVVVDASSNRLDHIKRRHAGEVCWLEFIQPAGVRVSIPHQRNVGVREARGDIIVFIDAACHPTEDWLARLVAPLRGNDDENMVAGLAVDPTGENHYVVHSEKAKDGTYLSQAGSANMAFRRSVFDAVGGFDESFAYGSDHDFCWRITDAGYRIRCVADAIIEHDWGTPQRQRRRSYVYGKARVRLYAKHSARRRHMIKNDPMAVVNPLFVLGLPVTLIFPLYPLLLLIPAWRYRSRGLRGTIRALSYHLWFGAGVLAGLVAMSRQRAGSGDRRAGDQ